jgi:hypothetical protein
MGWLSTFVSWFSRREKVSLSMASPDILEIIPLPSHSDQQKIIPGLSKTPNISRTVGSRGLSYFNGWQNTRDFIPPQYDHAEVETLYDIESYFARATRAKLALFLREGYDFIGTNDNTVEYIRTRIRQIERSSGIPFSVLLLHTCRDLLVHSNAYWLKVRDPKASGGRVRKYGRTTLKPVAGYFRLPPETMIPEIDSSDNITRWKQMIGGTEKIFSTNDIVHFYTNRKGGYPLGIPSIIPAVDDIRALRSLEHNIDILIHKHLFPIVLWKVGTEQRPAQTFTDGTTEIEVVQDAVANMPTEGSLVVSERYDVSAIGVENKALRVESYLQHFKERLLAGLDVSSIDVGQGNTSSRSTAHTLSRSLVDTVKMHQITIEQFGVPVIEELLLESTFDEETILAPENTVYLKFSEIDKEAKQAEANHIVDLFHKNACTYSEMRLGIGKEVLTPEEEKELWWNKFGREQALIGSVDELSGKGANPPASQNGAVANKNQPTNQNGSRGSAKLNRDEQVRDSYSYSKRPQINPLLAWHNAIGAELQVRFAKGELKMVLAESDIKTSYNVALSEILPIVTSVIRRHYHDPERVHGLIKYMEDRVRRYILRLRNEVIRRLKESDLEPNIVFAALAYRTILIFDTELAHARNIATYRWLKRNKINMKIVSQDSPCDICKPKLTIINWNDKLGEANIPPFHCLCSCRVVDTEGQA